MAPTTPPVPNLTALLTDLTTSLTSTASSLPPPSTYLPPTNGLSLLDVKNEALLAYLHHLTFLFLLRLRGGSFIEPSSSTSSGPENVEPEDDNTLVQTAGLDSVRKLVELRAFLERGVKPVEAKLSYQMEKVVGRSLDAELRAQRQLSGAQKVKKNKTGRVGDESDSGSNSESDSSNSSDTDSDSDVPRQGVVKLPTTDPDSLDTIQPKKPPHIASASADTLEELSFRPNPRALARTPSASAAAPKKPAADGIYRPPRISAVSMPNSDAIAVPGDKAAKRSRPTRMHELDDYVSTELSSVPVALPSIGATNTILAAGRKLATAKERRDARERTEYEEANFVRLPAPSKKDRAKATRMNRADDYGGEDWRGFVGDLDRITGRVERSAAGSRMLERSRKRKDDGGGDGNSGNSARGPRIGGKFSRVVGKEHKRRRKE